jgi:hypothetical protein
MKRVLIAVLVTLGLAALAAFAVSAAPVDGHPLAITRTPLKPLLGDAARAALSNFYKREQNFLNVQSTYLQKAGQLAATTQQVIDAAKAEGKDPAALEAALAQFNADIAQAQSLHDQAANILGAHSGFDNNGDVTNVQDAHQTLLDARLKLRSAHSLIIQAIHTLDRVILDWRASH